MVKTKQPSPNLVQLIHAAYSLADTLLATHAIKEIYAEWVDDIRHVFSLIDSITLEECGIPVFQSGIHKEIVYTQYTFNQPHSGESVLPNLVETAHKFGYKFSNTVNELTEFHTPTKEGSFPNAHDQQGEEINNLCVSTVNLIFNEIGLNTTGFIQIY